MLLRVAIAVVLKFGHELVPLLLEPLIARDHVSSIPPLTLAHKGLLRVSKWAVTWLSGFEVGQTLRHATMGAKCQLRSIDAEVVACEEDGSPDFRALHSGNYSQGNLCVWRFDLMQLDDEDLRSLPLIARKRKLEMLLRRHDHPYVLYSEASKNTEQLLAECRVRDLEGVLSKKKQAPYKSGKCDWIKVKCAQWKEENRNRGELFAR